MDQARAYVGTPPNKAPYFLVRLAPDADVEASAVDCGQSFPIPNSSCQAAISPLRECVRNWTNAILVEIKIGQTVLVRSAAFREREFVENVLSIAPIVQSSRISSRDQRNLTDISVAEVLIDLAESGPLTVGMKVDVYFRRDNP